ncbi:hypothetical protein WA158_008445 [Blastocystis sp. Blastoise]
MVEDSDPRIKTQILPIHAICKNNEFRVSLDDNIDVQSDTIGFVDLNLKGNTNIPVFYTNMNNQETVNFYNGSYTYLYPNTYYTLADILKAYGFQIALPSNPVNTIKTYGIETYPEPIETKFTINENNNKFEIWMYDKVYTLTIPNGDYYDYEYMQELTKQMSNIWDGIAQKKLYWFITYDLNAITMYIAKANETKTYYDGVTYTGSYSYKDTFYFVCSSTDSQLKVIDNVCITDYDVVKKNTYKFRRTNKYHIDEEHNKIFLVHVPTNDKKLIIVPTGDYTEAEFYTALGVSIHKEYDNLILKQDLSLPGWRITDTNNENTQCYQFYTQGLDNSLSYYKGYNQNIPLYTSFGGTQPLNLYYINYKLNSDGQEPQNPTKPTNPSTGIGGVNEYNIPYGHVYMVGKSFDFSMGPNIQKILGYKNTSYKAEISQTLIYLPITINSTNNTFKINNATTERTTLVPEGSYTDIELIEKTLLGINSIWTDFATLNKIRLWYSYNEIEITIFTVESNKEYYGLDGKKYIGSYNQQHSWYFIKTNYPYDKIQITDFSTTRKYTYTFVRYYKTDIIDNSIIISENPADITQGKSMLRCHSNLVDNSSNALCSIPISNPIGNNQLHEMVNTKVHPGLTHINELWFRFSDFYGNYIKINDGTELNGFIELRDSINAMFPHETIKNLCLSCETQDIIFTKTLPTVNLEKKNEQINCCYINGSPEPNFIFQTNTPYLHYSCINAPITIQQIIQLRFTKLFKGTIALCICEPEQNIVKFNDYDEVYCDFNEISTLSFQLQKNSQYQNAYLTNIQVISDNIEEKGQYKIYLYASNNYYQNILHIVNKENLPYFYNIDQSYESVKSSIKQNIYHCNRQCLYQLPKVNIYAIRSECKCIVKLTISYL